MYTSLYTAVSHEVVSGFQAQVLLCTYIIITGLRAAAQNRGWEKTKLVCSMKVRYEDR